MIFVIAGNFDEIRTRSGLILLILQPKLREWKETNKQFVMSESTKVTKSESEKAPSFTGVRRAFS